METKDVTVKVGQGTIGVVAMTGRNKCLEDASNEQMPGNPNYKIRNEMVLAVNDPKNDSCLAVRIVGHDLNMESTFSTSHVKLCFGLGGLRL